MLILSDELVRSPRDFACIWWAGSYPHNKISSGLNRILKHRNLPIKLILDPQAKAAELADCAHSVCFNHDVQVELRQFARQLLITGHTLIVARCADPLSGDLYLYPLPPSTPWEAGSLQAVALDAPDSLSQRQALNAISIHGLAAQAPRQQEQFFSGRYSLDYEEVRKRLLDGAMNEDEFRRELPPQPEACVSRGSWFAIIGHDLNGCVLLRLASSARRGASNVRLNSLDWSLLVRDVGQALQLLPSAPPLRLLQLQINTREEAAERFLLPVAQWHELALALRQCPPQTDAAGPHSGTK